MTTGRRRVFLSAGFFSLAVLFTSGTAEAQQKSHRIWAPSYTPNDLKAALSRIAGGEPGNLNPYRDQLLDLMKQQPQIDEKTLKMAKEILEKNPQLLEQAKQMAKARQKEAGRMGKLTQEDFAKLFKVEPGEVPKFPPDGKLPKFGPDMPDPNPAQPGKGDPRMPPDPNMPPGKVVQHNPDPPAPPRPKDKITLDENPFPAPQNADPRTKSLEAFAALWERNVGSLDEMPEVKRALFDLVSGEGLDFDLKDENGNSIWDLLKNGDPDGSGFGDLFSGGGNWDFGNFDFPRMGDWFSGWGGGSGGSSSGSNWWNSSGPRPSSSSGGGFGLGGDLGAAWVPFAILGVVILAVFVWIAVKNLKEREGRAGYTSADGLGPWPVDPRAINTREDVVKAFEYLSVLICGPSAKSWTHSTIADALSDLATTHGETAVMLARLYELARYAPLDEPLTPDELIEARKLVCGLAGVSY